MGDHRVPSNRPSVENPLAGLDDNFNPLPQTRGPAAGAHRGAVTGRGEPARPAPAGLSGPHAGAALGAVERRSPQGTAAARVELNRKAEVFRQVSTHIDRATRIFSEMRTARAHGRPVNPQAFAQAQAALGEATQLYKRNFEKNPQAFEVVSRRGHRTHTDHYEVGSLHTRLQAASLQLSRLDPNPKLRNND